MRAKSKLTRSEVLRRARSPNRQNRPNIYSSNKKWTTRVTAEQKATPKRNKRQLWGTPSSVSKSPAHKRTRRGIKASRELFTAAGNVEFESNVKVVDNAGELSETLNFEDSTPPQSDNLKEMHKLLPDVFNELSKIDGVPQTFFDIF